MSKTKKELEQEVKLLKNQIKNIEQGTLVKNCTVQKVINYDEDISSAVLVVATGLTNLTRLFSSQNIDMGTGISVGTNKLGDK